MDGSGLAVRISRKATDEVQLEAMRQQNANASARGQIGPDGAPVPVARVTVLHAPGEDATPAAAPPELPFGATRMSEVADMHDAQAMLQTAEGRRSN